jgi:hypothetical protein
MAATVENREPDQKRRRRMSYRAAAWLAWLVCVTLAAFSLLMPTGGRGESP